MPTEVFFTRHGNPASYIDRYGNSAPGEGYWPAYKTTFELLLSELRVAGFEEDMNDVLRDLRKRERPVVVDIMASTFTLRNLQTTYLNNKSMHGIAVGRYDHRTYEEKLIDQESGMEYVAGDIQNPITQGVIRTTLGSDKADFVMSTGVGGLTMLRTTAVDYGSVAETVWDILRPDGGTAALQLPGKKELATCGVSMDRWTAMLDDAGVIYKYNPRHSEILPISRLLLRRSPGVSLPSIKR